MEYEANIVFETDKSYKIEPINFKCNEDIFIPLSQVENGQVAQWLCKKLGLEGKLTLVNLPENGGNNGGAKVTNANLLSVPVEDNEKAIETEIEEELGDNIDDLTDIDSEGEPEPGKEEEQKDMFGEQAKKEIEKIKREQGQASEDEETHEPEEKIDQDKLRELEAYVIPKEICDRIDEIGDVFEVCVDQSKEIVKRKFGKYKLTGAQKSALEQDIATFTAIQVLRKGY